MRVKKTYRVYSRALNGDGGWQQEEANLHYGLAVSIFQQIREGKPRESITLEWAIDHLNRGLALDPRHGKAYILLAQVLLDTGARI